MRVPLVGKKYSFTYGWNFEDGIRLLNVLVGTVLYCFLKLCIWTLWNSVVWYSKGLSREVVLSELDVL